MDGKHGILFIILFFFNWIFIVNARPERWDEWIAFDSPRISPFRSRTAHSSVSTFLSPTPNILVSSAPCTGSNDVRVYLPEFSRLLNMIQPAMEELAYLAEEVRLIIWNGFPEIIFFTTHSLNLEFGGKASGWLWDRNGTNSASSYSSSRKLATSR